MPQSNSPANSLAPAGGRLGDRALIRLTGPDWRSFLQGLLTQDVETLPIGEVRYAALLTPQGRLLYDLFVWAEADGALLDVAAASRDALVARLSMYRLRAKVEIAPHDGCVWVWLGQDAPSGSAWRPDPRLDALGWRAVTAPADGDALASADDAYAARRFAHGVADPAADGLSDKAYALEANLDLLNAVDFKKGCFVGQETTSRMKRRGVVKTRLAPLDLDGEAALGAEVLVGSLRAGEICAVRPGRALALLRLDRAQAGELTIAERPAHLDPPAWLQPALAAIAQETA